MAIALHYVRFWGQSGHHAKLPECPLMTQSGHRVIYFAAMQSTVRSVMGNSSYFAERRRGLNLPAGERELQTCGPPADGRMAAHRGGCQVAIKPLSCSPNDVIKLVDDREPGRRGEEDCNPSVCPKCGASCPAK